jgi:hypothetical protein
MALPDRTNLRQFDDGDLATAGFQHARKRCAAIQPAVPLSTIRMLRMRLSAMTQSCQIPIDRYNPIYRIIWSQGFDAIRK